MLHCPPLCRGQLFQFLANKAFLPSPDQLLSPELYCRVLALTNTKMRRLDKCSTMRPLEVAHSFSFQQVRHVWKDPASGSHLNFIFGYLPTPKHRFGGSKSAPLRAPFQGPMFQVSARKSFLESPS